MDDFLNNFLENSDLNSFRKLTAQLYSLLLPSASDNLAREELEGIMTSCVRKLILKFDFTCLRSLKGNALKGRVIDLMTLCYEVGVGSRTYPLVLDGLLTCAQPSAEYEAHLLKVLCPLIPVIRRFLVQRGVGLNKGPYAKFCCAVVKGFVVTIVGRRPSDEYTPTQLRTFGCGCSDCDAVKEFFFNGTKLEYPSCANRHVKEHLDLADARALGVSTGVILERNPPYALTYIVSRSC